MAQLTEVQRNQFERYDLRERRPKLTSLSAGGQRFLAALTVLFIGVLGLLTYAAVQIFDGWHHLIVIGDLALVFFAVAAWIYSLRQPD